MTDPDRTTDGGRAAADKEIVRSFWEVLYERDWDRIAEFFGEDSEYTDVPSPADDVAHGPAQIVARLRLGLEKVAAYEHDPRLMVAEGGTVVTEHAETWHWHTGESVTLPFVSVHELREGRGGIVSYIDELKEVIRTLHGVESTHIESVPVKETFKGQTVWEGIVEVFELHNHPSAKRLYAWAHETDNPDKPIRHVTILHMGPVDSAPKAVQISILGDRSLEPRRKLKSGVQNYPEAKRRAGSCLYASRWMI